MNASDLPKTPPRIFFRFGLRDWRLQKFNSHMMISSGKRSLGRVLRRRQLSTVVQEDVWLPFTPNRTFLKDRPRVVSKGKGMYAVFERVARDFNRVTHFKTLTSLSKALEYPNSLISYSLAIKSLSNMNTNLALGARTQVLLRRNVETDPRRFIWIVVQRCRNVA